MSNRRTERLIRIGKADNKTLSAWREAVSLVGDFGVSIKVLQLRVASGRWRLARRLRSQGDALVAFAVPQYRTAIGRYYYSMYHAMRAAAYLHHDGDDHEAHFVLPSKTPDDFPNRAVWRNELKLARWLRNRADYDPYPAEDRSWKMEATRLKQTARQFSRECRAYLAAKGCSV